MMRRGISAAIPLLAAGTYSVAGDGPLSWVRGTTLFHACADHIVVPVLRRLLDAENAHNLTIRLAVAGLSPLSVATNARLETSVFGLRFSSPLGVSAGFDKGAEVTEALLGMGFGFVEVGGVTPQPQNGNPKPRLFRLLEDRGVINRFGLNSEGHNVVCGRLEEWERRRSVTAASGPVGVNLAKNTTSTAALPDYVAGVERLGPLVDFVVVNISCPNVAWTATLNDSAISDIVRGVQAARNAGAAERARRGRIPLPVLLKIGPDYDTERLAAIAKLALDTGVDGLIVSNTSSERPDSLRSKYRDERGGLSGAPIKEKSLATLREIRRLTQGKVPLIGVGGISSGADAYERIRAGASLVQLYTALVYEGPGLVKRVNDELDELLERDGFECVEAAVGIDSMNVS